MVVCGEFFQDLGEEVANLLGVSWACLQLVDFFLGAAACFAHFCKEDFAIRDATEAIDEADFRKSPDRPFGWIPLPVFDAVAIVVLELEKIRKIGMNDGGIETRLKE